MLLEVCSVLLQLTVCVIVVFLVEISKSEVYPSPLSNENKYHYPGIGNMYKTSFLQWLFWPLIGYISQIHVQYKGLERWPTNPFARIYQVANCNCCTWEFISRAWQSIIFRAKFDSCFSSLLLKEMKSHVQQGCATIEIRNLVGWPVMPGL